MGGSVSTGFDYEKQLFADNTPQSVEVKQEVNEKDCGVPRRSAKFSAKLLKYVDEEGKDGGAKTIWECFLRGSKGFPNNRMLGTRVFDIDEKKVAAIRAGQAPEAAPAATAAAPAADARMCCVPPAIVAAPAPSAAESTAAAAAAAASGAPAPSPFGAAAPAPAGAAGTGSAPAAADAKDQKGGDAGAAKPSHKAAAPQKDYGILLNPDKTLKRKEYKFMTYGEVEKEAIDFGAGLVSLGAKPKDSVGIWSINRPEWVVAFLGFHSQSFKTVSLYATLGADAVKYICEHAECEIVIAEKGNLKTLLQIAPQLKQLKHIIQIDYDARWQNVHEYVEDADRKAFEAINVKLHGFSEVRAAGAASKDVQLHPPTPDDLAYIMYTSGTTGVPKGAMLKHGNVVATIATVPYVVALTDKDVHISYLPLAHIFECVIECAMMSIGATIGFYSGIAAKLTEDMALLHPTLLCGVPKVFSTFYAKVMGAIAERNCMVQYLFFKTYNSQIDAIRARKPIDTSADAKYFGGIREKMGLKNTRLFITGAAPCRPYIMEFLRCLSGGNKGVVVQGYGMTETAAATSITGTDDVNMGHCGPPLPCCEVKLRDIPEMKYLHTDPNPRGEVLVRGANVFAGYYKNEQATKETLEADGWIATGDVGRWNPNGTLSIIDRKKNLFKLSQGEYIAAEKVEGIYQKSQAVGQIWIYGNSTKSTVVAVVVPNVDTLRTWAEGQGWWKLPREQWRTGTGYSPAFTAEIDELCTGPHAKAVKAFVFGEMQKLNGELNGLERCKDILIESKMDERAWGFHEGNDLLTPTNKLKRPPLLARYLKELKALYAANGEPTNANEKWPGEN